jgi:hypothetical protein
MQQPEADTNAEIPIGELKKLIEEANSSGSQTMQFAGQRLRLCVRIGRALAVYRKSIGHGGWMEWVKQNGGGITVETARKWISLARDVDSGRLNLEEARGVRQAYQKAGLLPDPDESASNNPTVERNYLVHIDRFETVLRGIDIKQLTADERQKLAKRLQPIAELYAALVTPTPQ